MISTLGTAVTVCHNIDLYIKQYRHEVLNSFRKHVFSSNCYYYLRLRKGYDQKK